MVFPSLSPFAGPLLGAAQPTRSEPPQDRGTGSPPSLNSPRRACQLQRWGQATSRCPRLILRATPSPRFSAIPARDNGPRVHKRSLPGHTAHPHSGRRARHHAHLQQRHRDQRRKRIASASASDGEPGDDCGGQAAESLLQPKNTGYSMRGGFGEYTVAAEMPRPASRGLEGATGHGTPSQSRGAWRTCSWRIAPVAAPRVIGASRRSARKPGLRSGPVLDRWPSRSEMFLAGPEFGA
jgi:hypothetical protein